MSCPIPSQGLIDDSDEEEVDDDAENHEYD